MVWISENLLDFLFVALGCPKQEKWIYHNAEKLNCSLLGVGAAFEWLAGLEPMPPRWMEKAGLGWLHRLLRNPKAERKAFAESMVEEITKGDSPKADEFKSKIIDLGLNLSDIDKDKEGFIKRLSGKVGDLVKSKRQKTAESLINFLIDGKPSQQFQSELVIKALGIDPENTRKKVSDGDYKTAISRIMDKLSSW